MSGVLALFERREDLIRAIREARSAGLGSMEAFAPAPDEELVAEVRPGKSPVRWMTLAGAVTGAAAGLVLTIGTTLIWPTLITGGKPLISLPPFLIIVFELTILFGALATIGGFLIWSVAGRLRNPLPYDPRFSQGHFGLWIECREAAASRVADFIKERGAIECEYRSND